MKKWPLIGFILLVPVLTLLTMHKALGFGFWRDDWLYVWGLEILKNPAFFSDLNIGVAYPLDLYRLVALSRILGVDPLGWQISNIVFRTFVPFASALFIYAVTKSKKISLVSGLFLAAGVAGVEPASFLGANNVTFMLIFVVLGFYFWISSLRKFISGESKLAKTNFIFAIIVFAICAKGEVWSYYLIPLLAVFWDGLEFLLTKNNKTFKLVLIRCAILIGVLLSIINLPPNPTWVARNNGFNKFKALKIENTKNMFASLGNLTLGSFTYVQESAGTSIFSKKSMVIGMSLALLLILFGISYLFKPTESKRTWIYFLAWTCLFYFPNWVFESTLVVGASHRYVTFSSVGLYALIAYIFSKLPSKIMWIAVILFLLINIKISNKVLSDLALFRSEKIVASVVHGIVDPINFDQKDIVIHYGGDGVIKGYILDWSLGIPVAIEKDITDRRNFPIWTGSDSDLLKLTCGKTVRVNLVGIAEPYDRGGYKLPLDHIYSYFVKDSGEVINNSMTKRQQIASMDCSDIRSN